MANYSIKAYIVNIIVQGSKPTVKGFAFAVLRGAFVDGLDIFKRVKSAINHGSKALARYFKAVRL